MAATLLSLFSLNAFATQDSIIGGEVNVVAGVESVLRIDLPNDITIRIEPGNKDAYTVPVHLGIYTNNPGGYFSYISTNKNRIDASDVIANSLNHVDDNRYKIDPLAAPTTIEQFPAGYWGYSIDGGKTFNSVPAANDTPALANTDSGLYFGVKVPSDQASGRYSNTIIATAVTRHVQTPDELFNGIEYMQDMTQEICETENSGMSKQLIDRRDGKKYWVTKMRDNSCWMTQNLDFEIASTGTTLTPADSNVFASRTITKEAEGTSNNIFYSDLGDYYIPNGDNYDDDGNPASTVELAADAEDWHYHVGSLYSWSAATAGSGNADTRLGEADESICPAGWRLPVNEGAIVQDRSYSFYRLFMRQPETWLDDDYYPSFNIKSIGTAPFYLFDARNLTKYLTYDYATMPFLPGCPGYENSCESNELIQREDMLFNLWTSTAYPAMNPARSSMYLWDWNDSEAENLALSYFGMMNGRNILGSNNYYYGTSKSRRNNAGHVRCVSAKNDLYSISTMQEVTPEIIRNTDPESTKRLVDTRDGKKYWVTKEYDGNLWMTENLDFEISTSGTQLSPATSDVLSAKTLTADASYGSDGNGIYYMDEGNYYYGDLYSATDTSYLSTYTDKQQTESHFRVGDFYSWNAATAGSGALVEENGGSAEESICPRGWRIPASGNSEFTNDGSFETMYHRLLEKAKDDNFENVYFESYYYSIEGMISYSPLFYHFTGILDSEGNNNGSGANYWTSTLNSRGQGNSSTSYMFKLKTPSKEYNLRTPELRPLGNDTENSAYGAKVRCVARNFEAYSLKYDANGGYGAPDEVTGVSQSREHTITISSDVPYRNGFNFIGWATSPSKTAAEYQPGDTITTSQGATTLYAIWKTTLQKFKCSGLKNSGDAIVLTDERDSQDYVVKKLDDGRCWMIDNLRLDFSSLVQDITPENTNNPTSEFMNQANASPRPSSSSDWCGTYGSAECYNQVLYNTTNNGNTSIGPDGNHVYSYGTYYNWYTAAAGQDPFDEADANKPYSGKNLAGDICPSGWHLPTGGKKGELFTMYSPYMQAGTLSTVLPNAGSYYGTNSSAVGHSRFYWVADDTSSPGLASFSPASNDGSTSTWPRYYGSTIKCVADYREQYVLIPDANGGIDAPEMQLVTSDSGKASFTLSYKAPTRRNFIFDGWATEKGSSKAVYQPGQTIVVTTPFTRLYAVWVAPFQGFNCSLLPNVGDTAAVKDSRDDRVYGVAKLADGHCWMTDDLELTFGELKTDITPENTNNPTSDFMTAANARPSTMYTLCTQTNPGCYDSLQYSRSSSWDSTSQEYKYHNYYNWYTATAGNGTFLLNEGIVSGDICPAGWHLPTGDKFGEYGALSNALGGLRREDGAALTMNENTTPTGAEMVNILHGEPNNFKFNGYRYGGSTYATSDHGYYWASTANGTNAYNIDTSTTFAAIGTTSVPKYYGYGVRCVADYQQEYSIIYEANGGSGAPATQSVTSGKGWATFTISSTVPIRAGYTFLGWSDSQGTHQANYMAGQTITVSSAKPTIRLYAVWQSSSSLQNFDCSSLTYVGDNVVVADSRDGLLYNVAKLADGKCWLTENLRLMLVSLQEDISASNTNNPSSAFISAASSHPAPTGNWCTDASQSCYEQIQYIPDAYGTYYNWYTATAGQGTYYTSGTTASGDLCPYGWHLPTGGSQGDFARLSNALGGYQNYGDAQFMNSDTTPTGVSMGNLMGAFPNNFKKAGYHYGQYHYGGVGVYWSSTSWGYDSVRNLYISDDSLDPTVWYGFEKYYGYPIRCLKN